jgi:replicative DNA helicase
MDLLERSLLGACLILGKVPSQAVAPGDFSVPEHAELWRTLSEMASAGRPLDQVLVLPALDRAGRLKDAGGAAYVSGLVDRVPDVENVEAYARDVHEAGAARRWRLQRGA